MSSGGWCAAVRFGVPGVLVGLIAAWALGVGRAPSARADAPGLPQANGTIAFTSSTPGSAQQWLYLIDTRAQSFAVYRVDPQSAKGTVKLEAARQYRWDMQMSEYNNLPPQVSAVESMVRASK